MKHAVYFDDNAALSRRFKRKMDKPKNAYKNEEIKEYSDEEEEKKERRKMNKKALFGV